MTLLLIRHAHAGERGTWAGDDDRRPLSDHGVGQAHALVDLLAPYGVDRIVSSPSSRCVSTVEPLAAARGLAVEPCPDLAEGTPTPAVRRLLRTLGPEDAALCSHGDVIGDLIGGLRAEGVDLGPTIEWRKASTWLLDLHVGRVRAGRYLPPP